MPTKIKAVENDRMAQAYKFVQDIVGFTNNKLQAVVSKKANLTDAEKGSSIEDELSLIFIFKELLKNKKAIPTNKKEKTNIMYSKYSSYCDEYCSYVRKLPMMILNNGIGASVAFLFSKSKENNAYEVLYDQIAEQLKREGFDIENSLMEFLVDADSTTHRRATIVLLAFLKWLKRFADGLIGEEDEKEVTNG
jgi:CRISPR-associated protein Cmr5